MTYKMVCGNCLDIMTTMDENSIDTIITDPPYGLNFMGMDWDHGVPGIRFWQAAFRVAKPGAILLVFGGTRTWHRLACAIEDAGWELRDTMMWLYGSGFPKSHDISKAINKAAGVEREVVGNTGRNPNRFIKFKEQDGCKGNPTNEDLTIPATPLASKWDGWGTALKPAFEPIIVAMAPRDGTYAHNAEKWGVAGLWIEGGRVGMRTENESGWSRSGSKASENRAMSGPNYARAPKNEAGKGRWPANVILDEEAAAMLDKQSGGASRFFYCAKASRAERNAGLGGMEERRGGSMCVNVGETMGLGAASSSDEPKSKRAEANYHPTVKPIALMRYLCRLTKSPTRGVVLDPFAGSGSTGCAAVKEGRDFIGIEINEEYYEIARRRIEHWAKQPPLKGM